MIQFPIARWSIRADPKDPISFDRGRTLVVDHHGPLAGHDRPTSLEQVFVARGTATT